MGFGRFKTFPLILCILSCIALTISTVTNYWYVIEASPKDKSHEGLWHICSEKCRCFTTAEVETWFKAVRAFMVLSVMAAVIAIICYFFYVFKFDRLKIVFPIAILAMSLLAIFSLTVYGIKKKTIGSRKYIVEYGWSYIAGWAGATVSLLAAIVGFFNANRTSS